MKVPRVLIIAGSDSGGGAGIQADIKTVTMLGGHAMTAVTAITAQNTLGVDGVMSVPAHMVAKQIDSILADLYPDAIKIGMIGAPEIAEAVWDRLAHELTYPRPIVFDPVMIATSGSILADQRTIGAFERLMRLSTVITPNALELAALTEMPVHDEESMRKAAASLAQRCGAAVLAKGGHLEGAWVVDVLVEVDGQVRRWEDDRIETTNSHGTGCTLASAIATGIGRGNPLWEAVQAGRTFVRAALLAAPGFGGGHGPMGHWLGVNPFEVIHRKES